MSRGNVKGDSVLLAYSAVANKGKGDLYRLYADSVSSWGPLDGRRVFFGRIKPGESITRELKVEVPRLERSGEHTVKLVFHELNGYQPDPVELKFWIEGLPRPQLAYSLQVIDDNSGNSVGNGDGRIQKGEAVDLEITVKNLGEGDAKNVAASLEGFAGAGLTLNVAEGGLGDLPPGESATTRLTLSTTKSARVASISGRLLINEDNFNESITDRLELPLDTEVPSRVMVMNRTARVVGDEAAIWGGAGTDTTVIAQAARDTTVTATGELPGWVRLALPDGKTGWIKAEDVSFAAAAPEAAAPSQTGIITVLQKAPPLIVLARPRDAQGFERPEITVDGVIADDSGVARYEVTHNGAVVPAGTRAISVVGEGEAARERRFSRSVTLSEGTNRFTVKAWDNEGLESSKTVTVTYSKPQGAVYMAVIGISDYQNVPRLKYAASDARAFAEYARRNLGVPSERVMCLYDGEADMRSVRRLLGTTLARAARQEDTVIIYFSGHGAAEADEASEDADSLQKYLLPAEADPKDLFSSAIPMDTVARIFERIRAKRLVFIADTCYSGAAGGKSIPTGLTRAVVSEDFLKRLARGSGRVVITASGANELAQETDELGHGVFTYYLLEGLRGAADSDSDGVVTLTEAYQYVSKRVPEATGQRQTPQFSGDLGGELLLGKTK
ncbi:MAG: caspase family protein [Planctomycetes bacterium]|nr:caspase family protein [Planctomycetota bacterium]